MITFGGFAGPARQIPVARGARVDLRQAVGRLGEVFGVDCIVSNAGGVLNGAFLRAGLVDEIFIRYAVP